jgi:hypothetical protein
LRNEDENFIHTFHFICPKQMAMKVVISKNKYKKFIVILFYIQKFWGCIFGVLSKF